MEVVRREIGVFEGKFNALKMATIQCLERFRISVMCVVYTLTALRADGMGQHKMFLQRHCDNLSQSQNHWMLFGSLNLYCWNYLTYHLLDHLIVELSRNHQYLTDVDGKTIAQTLTDDEIRTMEQLFTDIIGKMKVYKTDLHCFRTRTPLWLFCEAQEDEIDDPPPTFRKIVVKHNWLDRTRTATLEDVEKFRQSYLCHYNLRDFALMLNSIRPNTFTVTWFVPSSVVEVLKKERPIKVLKEFDVIRMEVAGSCVYEADCVSLVVQPQNCYHNREFPRRHGWHNYNAHTIILQAPSSTTTTSILPTTATGGRIHIMMWVA